MSLAWCISSFFISLMQSLNGAKSLNITLLFLLLGAAPSAALFVTVIVPLTSI